MNQKKIILILFILSLSVNLLAERKSNSINYPKCDLKYSNCIEICDKKDDNSDECNKNCDIKMHECEYIEKCESLYSICIEVCDKKENSNEECYQNCDIKMSKCEYIEKNNIE